MSISKQTQEVVFPDETHCGQYSDAMRKIYVDQKITEEYFRTECPPLPRLKRRGFRGWLNKIALWILYDEQ